MIMNASSILLNQNPGTLPNMADALSNWYSQLIFGVVTKTITECNVVETMINYTFHGLWLPLRAQQLMMKPEGQRTWKWFNVFTTPDLVLDIDAIITYLGNQYRVMAKDDYSLEGYLRYELVQDYTGAGPSI